MGILTNYQEIVGCCVQGGMPAEYAADHAAVLDWLGDALSLSKHARHAWDAVREAQAVAVQQAQQIHETQMQIAELNARCTALEAYANYS